MNGEILLDTNIVIALFAADDSVMERLQRAERVFVPSIVIGELLFGAHHSAQAATNIARVDGFAAQSAVLACNVDTARHYAQIKASLRAKGRPIPENDIWIAAVAQQHDLTLISRDTHFNEVNDVNTERW